MNFVITESADGYQPADGHGIFNNAALFARSAASMREYGYSAMMC